jgi:acyl-CoA reductase-like NAD-dependent aldehyde dehydrogenase
MFCFIQYYFGGKNRLIPDIMSVRFEEKVQVPSRDQKIWRAEQEQKAVKRAHVLAAKQAQQKRREHREEYLKRKEEKKRKRQEQLAKREKE